MKKNAFKRYIILPAIATILSFTSNAQNHHKKVDINDNIVATVAVNTKPDNIIIGSDDCIIPYEKIAFDIKHKWASPPNSAHSQVGLLVGDLDNDGVPEIVTYGSSIASNGTTPSAINVISGSDGSIKYSIAIPNTYGTGGCHPVMTAVLVDSDANGMGELILATNDGKLTSYEAQVTDGSFSLIQKWQTAFNTPTGGSNDKKPQPVVADFNGDGVPEVVVYNQIINAKTGAKLGETESIATAYTGRIVNRDGNTQTNFMTTADFDGDGLPEIAAGGKIYKVTISEDKTTATCSILYQTNEFADGFTSVADVDLDGKLDVVVLDYYNNETRINVWSPTDGADAKGRIIDQISIHLSDSHQSYPFIGDIDGFVSADGKRYPEICVVTREALTVPLFRGRVGAYKYDPVTKKYSVKWELFSTDTSGSAGITLFDFNNDGINELVYRDEEYLYVYNGVEDDTPVLASPDARFRCTSDTSFEYPVIADIDGDGSANICVTCMQNTANEWQTLNAFESATSSWAPTRKVWNQVNYEPTMINENLTVPTYPLPKQQMFEVKGEKYWPFNGALIQVSVMDSELNPVVRMADAYVIGITSQQVDAVTACVNVTIGNQGYANVDSSLPVSLYVNAIEVAGLVETKAIGVSLQPGEATTLSYYISLEQVKSQLIVRIQDDGITFPVKLYTDCDYDNNTMAVQALKAADDYASPVKNKPIEIDVLENDTLGGCDAETILLMPESNPANGTVKFIENKIEYTPNIGFVGTDSFKYKIVCGMLESVATIHIVVNSTLMVETINHASEPNNPGVFRIKFTDDGFTFSEDLQVYYTIEDNVSSDDYIVNPTVNTAKLLKGTSYVDVIVTPKDNFLVEGDGKYVQLTITGVSIES